MRYIQTYESLFKRKTQRLFPYQSEEWEFLSPEEAQALQEALAKEFERWSKHKEKYERMDRQTRGVLVSSKYKEVQKIFQERLK